MFWFYTAASFKDIKKTNNIAIDISIGIYKGVTDTSLGSEVDDVVKCSRLVCVRGSMFNVIKRKRASPLLCGWRC